MKRRIVRLLACPQCSAPLADADRSDAEELLEGSLACAEGHTYAVRGGVPRLVRGALEGDTAQTIDSFGYKWKRLPRWGMEGPSAAYEQQEILTRYGWRDPEAYARALAPRRLLLDVGAGLGREVERMARANPSAEVIGVELAACVDEAYANTRHLPNAHIVQADAMALPLPSASVDFILSEGVLHHTPDTRAALLAVADRLAPGGELATYLYVKKPAIREFADSYLRGIATRMSAEDCWAFSEKITRLGQALWELDAEIDLPDDIPELGITRGRVNVQRFFYYTVMKCYWNENFPFDDNVLFNFDWYHPAYAHSQTPAEVHAWYEEAGLHVQWQHVDGSGITTRGSRAAE